MTSADIHYPSFSFYGGHGDSALRDGVAMLGFGAAAHLMLCETGKIRSLLEAEAEGAPEPLRAYRVASDLVEAAGTCIYSLGEGAAQAGREQLEFFEGWQHFGHVSVLGQGVIGKTVSFGRTATDARLRNETLFIGWETDYEPPASLAPAAPEESSKAFVAFTELRLWLNMSVEEAADLIGVGRTTPVTSWEAKGHEPRPKKARRLYQLHAAVGAVIDQIGEERAHYWLHAGSPAPAGLMREPDLSAFADAVERLAIRNRKRFGPAAGSDVGPREDVMPVAPGGRRRRATVRKHR